MKKEVMALCIIWLSVAVISVSCGKPAQEAPLPQPSTTPSETPAPTEEPTPTPIPIPPSIPVIEVEWQAVSRISIPWGKLNVDVVSSRPAEHLKANGYYLVDGHKEVFYRDINHPLATSYSLTGRGDGTAFLVTTNHGEYFFTLDTRNWLKLANPQPGKSITEPKVIGAFQERNTLMLLIELQPEPWVFTYWRAEIPITTIEGLSP